MSPSPRRVAARSVHLRIPADVAEALDVEMALLEAHRLNAPPGHEPIGKETSYTDAVVAVLRAGLAAIHAARAKMEGR